ncbi:MULTISPECIES: MarR family winged helix-turn-helix transcriptional regulator [unclassified Oceanispirochaeta]|uniref:MarR family winged helix-turn-helix transcriptional regulator n=1 Tax=unclassified Oceanispirochaeta TaxID=2635722 RepID=UPI000E094FE8|nr:MULTISPECIES: MarR family transcriptional regulator [unclassified Oceanispirochaeta]MBF9015075.1 MarR family transcriptional regulator [Oceanispirochaeta sp. M2]NPD71533.1 MarR family transcriptional regulator [Oceanispirochaeta sp. M1]RDG33104.1 MarR family transcriptional regulator [Oceanispirochaeta sp. M1]
MNDKALRLDNQICFRLYKSSRTMIRLYQPILESLNITYPQYVTMLVMWEEDDIDFKELGRRLDLKTGTLTPIVKRLEILGYLYREMNPDDNRRIWVKITEKGRELKHNAIKIPEILLNYINMDMEQYQKYVCLLDELGEILEQAEIKQKEEVKK